MSQAALWGNHDTFILTSLDLFNWGGFNGRHHADIDPAGTAIIGQTGSGKTTLVDALMTLLCASPRYNLASTGGHESDRDLVSYVRGVSGPGDGGTDQSHIARPGKTVTGITATLQNGEKTVRLGTILWFEGTSSTASEMKKLWLFTESPQHTLEHWLTVHHEGGMRSLRQMDKTDTGIWSYPSKKSYLARLRDYFDVGQNAFTLLNRAAGLKQLNSIDEIFRELVLDDHSAFDRAAEVASSFDDLKDIHEELEIARRQQRSLVPVAEGWQQHQAQEAKLQKEISLKQLLPIWFAEQAHRLWKDRAEQLEHGLQSAGKIRKELGIQVDESKHQLDALRQAYLLAGGSGIEDLQARIKEWQVTADKRRANAMQYQQLVNNLGLPDDLDEPTVAKNQQQAKTRLADLDGQLDEANESAFQKGAMVSAIEDRLTQCQKEYREIKNRPGSNVPLAFQTFRMALAEELRVSEDALPFVAELIQVKETEHAWRGAIERAIGSNRLRILVPPTAIHAALDWVNQRHNQLHIRLLEVRESDTQPKFFDDGFARKLSFKEHPYREAVKTLLAGIDRHCVDDPVQLRNTPHALTLQGTMSGKSRYFDKQDQRRLNEDWLTGFDNRDQLGFLQQQVTEAEAQLKEARALMEAAKSKVSTLTMTSRVYQQLQTIEFDDIDLPKAEQTLFSLEDRLDKLMAPNSDIAMAKSSFQNASDRLTAVEQQLMAAVGRFTGLQKDFDYAVSQRQKAYQRAGTGLNDGQREQAAKRLTELSDEQLDDIQELERRQLSDLHEQVDILQRKLGALGQDLVKRMSDAKKEDRGALSEVGRELEDIPKYLQRLQLLTEEALPEKLSRFLEYLNRSSDEGVTQLLTHIDNEVGMIEERIEDLNSTMRRVDFQQGKYLQLVPKKVVHESLRTLQRTQRELNSARINDSSGETQYKVLQKLVLLLRDACDRNRTQAAKALLDPRFRLEFAVSVIDRETGNTLETRTGSQGGSGGEKEIIASYVLTASLSYALCPAGSSHPLFGTIVLDEAFSRSSHTVAGRIIAALRAFGLHAIFITPNKEMRLLRNHTRSAILVARKGTMSNLTSFSWESLDDFRQRGLKRRHEITE